tara:strand:- start:514 stop:891 length:378 start_codon:yes stop_codon:yes gene_type:complete
MYKFLLLSAILLSGCSAIPSFYDDNESKATIDVQYHVNQISCEEDYLGDLDYLGDIIRIKQRVDWLKLYALGKGSKDVHSMVELMSETVDGFYKKGIVSKGYCSIKKKLLIKQSGDITAAIMGRF